MVEKSNEEMIRLLPRDKVVFFILVNKEKIKGRELARDRFDSFYASR
jgi:hypothetical protein